MGDEAGEVGEVGKGFCVTLSDVADEEEGESR